MQQMQLDISTGWSNTEMSVLSRVLGPNGIIRSTRPKGDTRYDKWAYYVWRNIVWHISEERAHQCMPVMCYYELPAIDDTDRRKQAEALDELVDKVMKLIPVEAWRGVIKWQGLI